jgi:hypothetical protein
VLSTIDIRSFWGFLVATLVAGSLLQLLNHWLAVLRDDRNQRLARGPHRQPVEPTPSADPAGMATFPGASAERSRAPATGCIYRAGQLVILLIIAAITHDSAMDSTWPRWTVFTLGWAFVFLFLFVSLWAAPSGAAERPLQELPFAGRVSLYVLGSVMFCGLLLLLGWIMYS